ncbi:hypothetical protein MMB17_18565 [Methylobacterium organophilum]|uniref:hypothetical protein n=1 Tax=Methylobacterium organophilum TaxID=410 RepID=UPI001F12C651|nr:hypothetical protein [Methylobacterium organophilum]UMY16666.1 hypothetical protein MMB17_18565 [Methylobacterium organophilum]
MGVPVWPGQLPYRPLRTPIDMTQRYAPAISTPMEEGPTRNRPSSTSVWTQFAYQMRLSSEEFEVADDFVVRTLVRGTLRFMMPVGRFYAPDPWPQKLVYLEGGVWRAKPVPAAPMQMLVSFTLNVLDW